MPEIIFPLPTVFLVYVLLSIPSGGILAQDVEASQMDGAPVVESVPPSALSVQSESPVAHDEVLEAVSLLRQQLETAFTSIERRREEELVSEEMFGLGLQKRPSHTFVHIGKRLPRQSFLHFGERSPLHRFLNFGRNSVSDGLVGAASVNSMPLPGLNQPSKRRHNFVRFGRTSPSSTGLLSFYLSQAPRIDAAKPSDDSRSQKRHLHRFVRFGRSVPQRDNPHGTPASQIYPDDSPIYQDEDGDTNEMDGKIGFADKELSEEDVLDDGFMVRVPKSYHSSQYLTPFQKRYRHIRVGRLPAVLFFSNRPSGTSLSQQTGLMQETTSMHHRNSLARYG